MPAVDVSRLAVRAALISIAGILGVWVGIETASPRMESKDSARPTATVLQNHHPTPDHQIPADLPEFSLENLAGGQSTRRQFEGKALLINFWATWCAPCRHEIPLLKSLAASQEGQAFAILGVAVDRLDAVRTFVAREALKYPIVVGGQEALDFAAALGVDQPVFPFSVFTDRRHRIVTLILGELEPDRLHSIVAIVQEIDTRGLSLPAAQQQIARLAGPGGK